MTQQPSYPPIRRIVTGHDANNVAKALVDAPATNSKHPDSGLVSTLMWVSDRNPADISIGTDIEDMGARILGTAPPTNGTRFSVLDLPPGNPPFIHRTESLDYIVVIDGEVDMDMDESTVKLKAGDIVIQRGTHHAWVNRSDKRARIAVILVDAAPLGIGKVIAGNSNAK